jgi:hypothetical protein
VTIDGFLFDRIAEDEAAARSAEPWAIPNLLMRDGSYRKLAAHDPARVLAECEAKRRIVESWTMAEGSALDGDERVGGVADGLRSAVEALAAAYADHPDYQEEWR